MISSFQSTFPRGERHHLDNSPNATAYFNPRSRVGNDIDAILMRTRELISIHVPAWGTTSDMVVNVTSTTFYFNPRSRVGNDSVSLVGIYDTTIISIHVPAWGTTVSSAMTDTNITISIHVPAWGTTLMVMYIDYHSLISIHVPAWGTTWNIFKCVTFSQFQSTFPRGERRE